MRLRNRLTALFSPTFQLVSDGTVLIRGGILGPVQWVVPRARCLYRRIELPGLPMRQRLSAARIAARRYEPAAGAKSLIAWQGETAHIWIWEQPDAGHQEGEGGPWLPESLLHAALENDGVRLVALVYGMESQYWREGVLQASQWWPALPDAAQWRRFVRACGLSPDTPVPDCAELPWVRAAWAQSRRARHASPASIERWAWRTGMVLVALVVGWQLASVLTWDRARRQLDGQMEALRAQAAPLLAARERAEMARDAIGGLQRLQSEGASDYLLMAEVVARLPDDARFTQWRREGDGLQLVVRSVQADPRVFVSAFADHPQLAQVTAAPGQDGQMDIEFRLPAGPDAQAPEGDNPVQASAAPGGDTLSRTSTPRSGIAGVAG